MMMTRSWLGENPPHDTPVKTQNTTIDLPDLPVKNLFYGLNIYTAYF